MKDLHVARTVRVGQSIFECEENGCARDAISTLAGNL